jgi:glycosyltransferase involved in cell wall biosynthesis
MRVLYAAYRHDPRNPDLASGSDYHYYKAIENCGHQISLLGPFQDAEPIAPERLIRKIYTRLTHLRYVKFPLSTSWQLSQMLNYQVKAIKPDLVFTIFPLFLMFYSGLAPCVYRLDTSLEGWQQNYPEFGRLAARIQHWQERRAFQRVTRIITQSDWSKQVLVDRFYIDPNRIDVFPNPAALPSDSIPSAIEVRASKNLDRPLDLLLVGRGYERKGIGIAIEIARLLNEQGRKTTLTICGTLGIDTEYVRFVGPFKKSIPEELRQYIDLYKRAHFLLHPAIFEAAGITPSEAAAFGTPTITNNTGGLATTVKDNVSGIVLSKGSKAEAYVEAIVTLTQNPDHYFALCESTRRRYEDELNWEAASKRVAVILQNAVAQHPGAVNF